MELPNDNAVLKKTDGVDAVPLGDSLMVMDPRTAEVYMLNDVGLILWEAIDAFPTEADLVGLLAEGKPGVPVESHREQVRAFLAVLVGKGFLTSAGAADE